MRRRELMWAEENEAHIARHQVTSDEVEQVVHTRPRWVTPGRGGTELVYGTTDAGRYLLVVLTESMDGRDYVVTARPMDRDEQREFRRRAH